MKKRLLLASLCLATTLTFGCGASTETSGDANQVLKVGVTAGPQEEVMLKVEELAAPQGLDIEVVVFNDYIQPNTQLAEGGIDLNSMQHEPFLNDTKETRGLKLSNIGKNITMPMGILSETYTSVDQIPENGKIGIPNDSTNMARALILIEEAGLIKLEEGIGVKATQANIVENPKNLQFIELEAGMLLRSLTDFDAAAINSNYVVDAGLNPQEEAIFIEPKDSPWVNIFVCREGEEDRPEFKQLIDIYQSEEVENFINEKYNGGIVSAWN